MEKMIYEAAGSMYRKMDDEVRSALNAFWPVWTLDDVKRRCQIVRVAGQPLEILCADGIPLLEIYPVETSMELKGDRYVMTMTRRFRNPGSTQGKGVSHE